MEMTWIPIIGVMCFLLGIGFHAWVKGERAIADTPPELVEEQVQPEKWEQEFDRIMENAWRNSW